jgi:hypothetical protein
MKLITMSLLLMLSSILAFSQSKIQGRIYTEGSWFIPHSEDNTKKGFSTGGGVLVSYPLHGILSVSLGAGYRYKTNEATFYIPDDSGSSSGGYGETSYKLVSETFPQHYLVVPLKFRIKPENKFFLEAGFEATWLLNYDIVNEKPEYNWAIGAGYHLSTKADISLSYMQGFKEQGMGNKNRDYYGQIYKNRMLMVSISYAIFD